MDDPHAGLFCPAPRRLKPGQDALAKPVPAMGQPAAVQRSQSFSFPYSSRLPELFSPARDAADFRAALHKPRERDPHPATDRTEARPASGVCANRKG